MAMNPLDKYEINRFLEDKESLKLMARACRALYDSFVAEGFSAVEALELTKHLIPMGKG